MKTIYLLQCVFVSSTIFLLSCNNNPSKSAAKTDDTATTSPAKTKNTPPTQATPNNFDTYCNARFGYCIDYPAGKIYPQPEAQNGDGCVFKNKAGDDILTVYGALNQDVDGNKMPIDEEYDEALHDVDNEIGSKATITYQKLGKTFFVMSGYSSGKIFYRKTIIKGDAYATAILQYSESEKSYYNKVSEQVFTSFR